MLLGRQINRYLKKDYTSVGVTSCSVSNGIMVHRLAQSHQIRRDLFCTEFAGFLGVFLNEISDVRCGSESVSLCFSPVDGLAASLVCSQPFDLQLPGSAPAPQLVKQLEKWSNV